MKRRALLVVLAYTASLNAGTLLPERVYKAAAERVAAGEYPALVIGYIEDDKSEVATFGRLDDGHPPRSDTVFELASVTKTFTATLLAQMVVSGKLTLDTPVANLLPDFKIPSRGGRPITLEELATHTSGLPRVPTNVADPSNAATTFDAAHLQAFLASVDLGSDPGTRFEYSNLGGGLLGFALARNAHMTYADLVATRILRPLGMAQAGVVLAEDQRAHLGLPHQPNGSPLPLKDWRDDALAGAGGLHASADDMLRWLRANMRLQPEALAAAMRLAQAQRREIDRNTRIGLAWFIDTSVTPNVIMHDGGSTGEASFVGFTSDRRRGVVVLTNIDNNVIELGLAALNDLSPLRTAGSPKPAKYIEPDAATLDEYVGTYEVHQGGQVRLYRKDNRLFAESIGTGHDPYVLSATSKDEFATNVANRSLSIERDALGNVKGVVIHLDGIDRFAPRVAETAAAKLPPNAVQLDPHLLDSYVGRYTLAPEWTMDITRRGDRLYAQLTGQQAYPLYASAEDKFFYEAVDARVEFERDAAGHVVALVLHQHGMHRAPRANP